MKAKKGEHLGTGTGRMSHSLKTREVQGIRADLDNSGSEVMAGFDSVDLGRKNKKGSKNRGKSS